MMILPTIIGTTESAIRAVPSHYYEGSLALGATKERSIFRVIIPAAKSGVIAGIVLGIGRAIGETMAVIMIVGNQARLTGSILDGIRTLTGNIVIEDGLCDRPSQRSADRNRSCTLCVHPHHQLKRSVIEEGGGS